MLCAVYAERVYFLMIMNVLETREINKIFGANLLRLIVRADLSQNKLAASMNVQPSYINAICKGRKYVSESTLLRLCAALKAKPWEFYIDSQTPVLVDNFDQEMLKIFHEAKSLGRAGEALRAVKFVISEAYAATELLPKKLEQGEIGKRKKHREVLKKNIGEA
jgi:transcriptional regulator with XRE-family HTH domain